MNDLTKTDLNEIYRCLKYMTKGGTTPYSCHTIALVKKVRGLIENYCDHEKVVPNYDCQTQCDNCGVIL